MNTSPSSVVQQKPGAKQRFQPLVVGGGRKEVIRVKHQRIRVKLLRDPLPLPFLSFFFCVSVFFSKRKQVVQDRATAFFSLFCTVAVITWVSQTKLGD